MKTATETKRVGYTKHPTTGRAAFIHKLRRQHVPKLKALKKTQSKFNASEKAFDSIWSTAA